MDATAERVVSNRGVVERVLVDLQGRIGPQKFNVWFRHGTKLSLEDGHLRVSVPNPFVANWVEAHYVPLLAELAAEQTHRPCPVVVTIDPDLSGDCRKRTLDMQAEVVSRATSGTGRTRGGEAAAPLRYRLDGFIVGESNRLAYGAAVAISADRAPFHSLFVHGPCGVGKTHLVQGICNAASRTVRNGRPLECRYVTAESFTNDFVTSLRRKKLDEFRARYRHLDLLVIDDVHFLAAKKATQDEFLHTFNAIQTAGKRLVLASDTHPRLVGELNEQLTSRFLAGMVVKIDAPDHPTRLEILRRKADGMKLDVAPEALDYLAVHVRNSVREMEGALVKLSALSALENGPVTLRMATDALADHLARTGSAVTLGDIEAVVAAYFGVTPADIHSSRRTKTVSNARMVAMHLARRHTRMSFPEIGRFMGKNHSSVVLAVQRFDKLLQEEAPLVWNTPAGHKSLPARQLIQMLNEQLG